MSVDCLKRRRYAALVGLGRPFCLGPWDEGEDPVHSSLSGFDTRTMPRTRHVWGTRQSRWLRTADGFAVCGLYLLSTNLRTDECKYGTRSKGVGEHYAGKHEGKCHADKSESKAVFGMRTRQKD